MQEPYALHFGPYRLAGPHGPFFCLAEEVKLPPKAVAVLWALVSQAGQVVVTKAALLDAVWPEVVVGEDALGFQIQILRQALKDDARRPHYIATVHRVGYRFIEKVVSSQHSVVSSEELSGVQSPATGVRSPQSLAPGTRPLAAVLVGREAELSQLHSLFVKAVNGDRQIVFVTGEAGIGKTALIETFMFGVRNQEERQKAKIKNQKLLPPDPWLAWGQCIEHYGAGEAYLPVLEAFGRLSREVGGERLVAVLHQYAPSWLVQLPALLSAAEGAALQQRVAGTTRERMLREMAEALEVLSAEQPLIIVLEDLHWSDVSTIDLLSMLARRREAARLLILATYRPTEVIVSDHRLKTVKQEIVTRGLAVEVPLPHLRAEAVQTYVQQRVAAQADVGPELAPLVYERTEGHPLFMVQVVDEVVRQGALRSDDARLVLPQQLRQLIAAQLERLTAEEQQVLEAGSVAGAEFSVASVAAGVQRPPEVIETICEELARRGQFVDDRGVETWPDETASGRYGFRHTLYQEVLYKRIGTSRRVRLHQLIGQREEAGYGEGTSGRAAGLAMHFEQGQDYRRAVHYLAQAARRALHQSAAREAVGYLTRGLTLLAQLPESAERHVQELRFQSTLGVSLMLTAGHGAQPVEQVYQRAWTLHQELDETPVSFTARCEFWHLALTQADLRTACKVAEQLVAVAQQTADPESLALAHYTLGTSLYYRGDWATVREYLERGLATYKVHQDQFFRLFYTEDRGVVSHCHLAVTLWCLGYPEQVQRQIHTGVALAQQLARPLSQARALSFAVGIAYFRHERAQVRELTKALLALGAAHSAFWQLVGTLYQGAMVVAEEQTEVGLEQVCQAVARYRSWGQLMVPYLLSLVAEAQVTLGHAAEGVAVLDEALAVADKTGEQWYDAELWRLKGELTLQKLSVISGQLSVPGPRTLIPNPRSEAEACFLKAIEIAQRQQAKSLELRAVMSLVRLRQQQVTGHAKRNTQQESRAALAEAHALLDELYGWFTEGFDTKDLQDAKALIEELSH